MKRFTFLQVGLLAALLVTIVSCSTPRGASGEYYEEAPARGNVYYADPYYGGVNPVIIERDPYTGRYYPVNPGYYGGTYGARAYPYGYRNYKAPRGYYNNNRNRGNYRNYNNSNGNNGYYKTYPQAQQRQQPQQSPAQRQQMQQQRDEAKGAILGPKKRS